MTSPSPEGQSYGLDVLYFQYSRRRRKEKQERQRDAIRRNPTSSPQPWLSPASSLCTMEPSAKRKADVPLRNQCRRFVLLQTFPNPVYKLWEPYYFIVFYFGWMTLFKNPTFLNSYGFCHILDWFLSMNWTSVPWSLKAQFDDAEWTMPSTCCGPGPSLNSL